MKRKLKQRNQGRLPAIRVGFGCTQQQFAQLLGVSRSSLAMAETGCRKLPIAAYRRLLQVAQWERQRSW